MPDNKIYIEENRLCEESYCKHLKRLLVGFIRFIESSGQEANIPEVFFDDVPDNVGYSFEYLEDEEGNDVRGFRLTEDWKTGTNDCGGEDHDPMDVEYHVTPTKTTVHLKLIPND